MSMLETMARPAHEAAVVPVRPISARLADYRELAKPRIAAMALLTVSIGYFLGDPRGDVIATFLHALLGIGLVAAGSGTLNQLLERRTDAKMLRTANRPLPAGRLSSTEALVFGVGAGAVGTAYLAVFVNGPTAVLSAVTLLLYVFAYTPLKRVSSLCTLIGAFPGALPPVLGWAAAGGGPPAYPLVLFGILFLWQFPHLLAIAWLYRRQYADAGLHMLPGQFPRRGLTGGLSVVTAMLLLPVSLLTWFSGHSGLVFAAAAIVLGAGYVYFSLQFLRDESAPTARRLLWSSLIYLPLVLGALLVDHALLH